MFSVDISTSFWLGETRILSEGCTGFWNNICTHSSLCWTFMCVAKQTGGHSDRVRFKSIETFVAITSCECSRRLNCEQ